MSDDPIRLRPEDSPEPVATEIVRAPRRVRAQLVQLDGQILGHQDTVEELYAFVPGSEGRRLLNRLYSGLEQTHCLLQKTTDAVERG